MSWNLFIAICIEAGVAVLICRALVCLIEERREWWRRVLLFAGSFMLVNMIIYAGDPFNFPFAVLAFLFCIWNACRGSRRKRVTIGLMFASTMLAMNGLYDSCIAFFMPREMSYVVSRVFTVILLYTGIYRHRPERDFELSQSLWGLLLLLCMPPLGILCALTMFRSPFISLNKNLLDNAVLFLVAALAFAGNLWAMLVLNKQQMLERERTVAEYNKKYYEAMEQQHFEIRRLKHDLANHLQVLLSLPAKEKDGYIQKMIENPVFERVLTYSGDATVNAVLTAKESLMRQKEITFYAKVDIPQELAYEKPDLCALFANALDNAVEACAALEAPGRQIALTARAAKGILAVEVRNPFAKEQDKSAKGLPGTTKADTQNHGFGLRSIQEIVKKYGGDMELKQEDGWFILLCYMPLPVS